MSELFDGVRMYVVGEKEEITTQFIRDMIDLQQKRGYDVESLWVREGSKVDGVEMKNGYVIVDGLWLNNSLMVPVNSLLIGGGPRSTDEIEK